MKSFKILFFIIFTLFWAGFCYCEENWISFETGQDVSSPQISVVEANENGVIVDIEIPGMFVDEVTSSGFTFEKISIPECSPTIEIGMPELPVVRKLVAIPGRADVRARLLESSEREFSGYTVFPFQTPTFDAPLVRGLDWNIGFYNSSNVYPEIEVTISEPAIWRDLRIVSMNVNPFTYYPASGRLVVKNYMRVELVFEGENPVNAFERDSVKPVSSRWAKMYRDQVINYDYLELPETDNPGTKYLVISHPNFVTAIQTLAGWNHKRGLETYVLSLNTTNPTTVKNEIISRYNSGELDYVLLVGDTGYIPTYTSWGVACSDHWYACVVGSDAYPELAIGRISTTNTTNLNHQMDKILKYMKNPPTGAWLESTLLVAHKENAPAKYVGCKDYIRNTILPGFGWTVHVAYGNNASGTNTNVANKVNSGINVLNYRGHGSTTEWWQWSYLSESWTNSNISTLSNGEKTPIVLNIACDNGKISQYCLSEAWMDATYGACASLAASDPSYTEPNHDYDKALYRAFVQNGIYSIGYVSNYAATQILPQGSYAETNVKMYLWLGDPSTEIWTDAPAQLTAEHAAEINTGSQNFTVTVKSGGTAVQGAAVCLYKGAEVYKTGTTNASGQVTISINPTTAGYMLVTATKHNYFPAENTVTVAGGGSSLEITLNPQSTVIKKPGTLVVDASIKNLTGSSKTTQVWIKAKLPNGSWIDVFGPQKVTLAPNQTLSQQMQHQIPAQAPIGTYDYFAYAGTYPSVVEAQDSFSFTVTN